MFHKVIEHSRRYPEATPLLMLSILPFLALTDYCGPIATAFHA